MRNAVNKMTNLIDPYTENHFLSFIENLSDMELSVVLTLALSGCHWLRRPLHGSLHRSWVDAVYPTLKLICDFWPSKFSHYPSRPVPLPEVFVTTRPDPVPKSKTTTRQALPETGIDGPTNGWTDQLTGVRILKSDTQPDTPIWLKIGPNSHIRVLCGMSFHQKQENP